MFRAIMDIFSAGTETTATTMTWITLFVATHPHVLKKCQEEVDQVSKLYILNNNIFDANAQKGYHRITTVLTAPP